MLCGILISEYGHLVSLYPTGSTLFYLAPLGPLSPAGHQSRSRSRSRPCHRPAGLGAATLSGYLIHLSTQWSGACP